MLKVIWGFVSLFLANYYDIMANSLWPYWRENTVVYYDFVYIFNK
jgi:hypothetical protein